MRACGFSSSAVSRATGFFIYLRRDRPDRPADFARVDRFRGVLFCAGFFFFLLAFVFFCDFLADLDGALDASSS